VPPELVSEVAQGIFDGSQQLQRAIEKLVAYADLERLVQAVRTQPAFAADRRSQAGAVVAAAAREAAGWLQREGELELSIEDVTVRIDAGHLRRLVSTCGKRREVLPEGQGGRRPLPEYLRLRLPPHGQRSGARLGAGCRVYWEPDVGPQPRPPHTPVSGSRLCDASSRSMARSCQSGPRLRRHDDVVQLLTCRLVCHPAHV